MLALFTSCVLLTVSFVVAAQPVNRMPNVKDSMLFPEYWIQKMSAPDEIIMGAGEIEQFNRRIEQDLPDTLQELTVFPEEVSRDWLIQRIDRAFPNSPRYIGSEQINDAYYQTLRDRLNLNQIKDSNPVSYGFTVRRTDMRAFPTADSVSDEPNDPEYDEFQNTAVLTAEPLIVLHRSQHGEWLFCQIYNCSGWVRAADVALTGNRQLWQAYQRPANFLVVTGNRIRLNVDPYSPELSELEFSMGARLPLVEDSQIPALVANQVPTGNYVVKLPVRKNDGGLDFKLALVPVSNDVHEGYLPYTRANIIRQAFKLEGDRYGWGGMFNARDCSSLVMEVFRCFGFYLPRNTDHQAKCTGMTLKLEGQNQATRVELLKDLQPGALLYFNGHVMLYLGQDNGSYYVINALGSYGRFTAGSTRLDRVRVHGVVVNDLNLHRVNGKLFLNELTVGKQLETPQFDDVKGHWAGLAIQEMASSYVTRGRNGREFKPDEPVTRGEFADMISRLLQLDSNLEAAARFEDLTGNQVAGRIGAVAAAGYFTGVFDKRFDPDGIMSRAQMACVLTQVVKGVKPEAVNAPDGELLAAYSDHDRIPSWALKSMAFTVQKGLLTVRDAGRLVPLGPGTRAEAASILCRLRNDLQNDQPASS